ncbi:hypothetical protein [Athalassotoga sp.]|uniref:hypothetical protein n=1 Tax=Athalassotoga sp. TaxID=2022597 RepID=UPI003D057543
METMREYLKKAREQYLKQLWDTYHGDISTMSEISGMPTEELKMALKCLTKGGKHDGLKI